MFPNHTNTFKIQQNNTNLQNLDNIVFTPVPLTAANKAHIPMLARTRGRPTFTHTRAFSLLLLDSRQKVVMSCQFLGCVARRIDSKVVLLKCEFEISIKRTRKKMQKKYIYTYTKTKNKQRINRVRGKQVKQEMRIQMRSTENEKRWLKVGGGGGGRGEVDGWLTW